MTGRPAGRPVPGGEAGGQPAEHCPGRWSGSLDVYDQLPTAKAKNDMLKEVLEKVVYTKESGGRWAKPDAFEIVIYPKIPAQINTAKEGPPMIDDYMLTDLSPYRVLRDASKFLLALNKTFARLGRTGRHSNQRGRGAPGDVKAASSLVRKDLMDCYYENGYYGGAMDQYRLALELNPRLPVKRRIRSWRP